MASRREGARVQRLQFSVADCQLPRLFVSCCFWWHCALIFFRFWQGVHVHFSNQFKHVLAPSWAVCTACKRPGAAWCEACERGRWWVVVASHGAARIIVYEAAASFRPARLWRLQAPGYASPHGHLTHLCVLVSCLVVLNAGLIARSAPSPPPPDALLREGRRASSLCLQVKSHVSP